MKISRMQAIVAILGDEIAERLCAVQDFAVLEKEILQETHQALCRAHALGFTKFDDALSRARLPHLKIKDRTKRTILSLAGPITLSRYRYLDALTNVSFSLADVLLDMAPSTKITAQAAALVAGVGAETRYRGASEVLEIFSGHRISPSTVQSALKKTASIIGAKQNKGYSGTRKAPLLCCEVDEISFALQQRAIPKERRKKKMKGAKIASIYEGKKVNKNGTKSRVSRRFLATTKSSVALWKQVDNYIEGTYDTISIKRTHLGVDGASWCSTGTDILPGTVTVSYDLWHVHKIIKDNAGRKLAPEIIATMHGAGVMAARECAQNYGEFCDRKNESHKLWALVKFFTEYQTMIENGIKHNLGTQEGTNAHLVGSRMKNYGGGWSILGGDAVITVRAAKQSGFEMPLIKASSQRLLKAPSATKQSERIKAKRKRTGLFKNCREYYHPVTIAWENEANRIKHNMAAVY